MKSRQNKMRRLRQSLDRFSAQFEPLEDRRLMTVTPVVSDVAAVVAPVATTPSLVAAPASLIAGTAASSGVVAAPSAVGVAVMPAVTAALPVISLPTSSIPVNGGNSTPIEGISVYGDGFGNLMVTISVQHGTLELPDEFGLSVSGDGTSTITLIGSQWAIDAALEGVSEVGYPNFGYPAFEYPIGIYGGIWNVGATLVTQGLDYTANAGFTGTDSLSVSAQQLAYAGGPIYPIYPVYPIYDPGYPIFEPIYPVYPIYPIYEPFFPPPVVCMPCTAVGSVATQPLTATTFTEDAASDSASTAGVQADSLATSEIATSDIAYPGIVGWPIWSYPEWIGYQQPIGPSAVATSTLTLDVKTQVLPPAINIPSTTQTTSPTAPIVFSAANGNAISITDPGVGTQPIQVTLNTQDVGTLTLGSTTGVTISGDGNDSSYVTITGSVTDINSALDGLAYTPSTGFIGNRGIYIWVDDLGNTSWGQPLTSNAWVDMDVQQLSVPTGQAVSQGSTLVFNSANGNAISLANFSSPTGPEQLQLSVDGGTLTLGNTAGLTFIFGGNGTSSMSISGSITDLNNALAGLTYTPNAGFTGSDLLSLGAGIPINSGNIFQDFEPEAVPIQVTASTSIQAPKVTPSGTTNTFAVGGAAVPVDLGMMVSSSDADLTGATVTISPGTLQAGDSLNFINQNGITGSYAGGVLTLSGSATPTQYAAALQSITFSTSSTATAARAISIVALDNALTSNSAAETVDVTVPVTVAAPVVTPAGTTNTFTVGGASVAVDAGVTVSSNDTDLTGATVTISSPTLQTGDTLNFVNQNGISGNFSGGVLTLSGSATPAQYQAALQSITFSTTSTDTTTRAISIVALDNALTSNAAAESVAVSGAANPSIHVTKNSMPVPTPDTDHGFEHGRHGFVTASATSPTSAATLFATTGGGSGSGSSGSSGASTNGATSSSSRSGHSFAAVDAAIADFDLTDLSI